MYVSVPDDWCPLAKHPCLAACEVRCNAYKPPSAAQKLSFVRRFFPGHAEAQKAMQMLDAFEKNGVDGGLDA